MASSGRLGRSFFDLKSSTNLEKGRKPASTASSYDAGVGGVVKILDSFDANFVDIQGDGGFGLFWGEGRYERAICAGITVRTFGSDFTLQLNKKWPTAPSTGFKVGVASGPILVKKVGLPKHLAMVEEPALLWRRKQVGVVLSEVFTGLDEEPCGAGGRVADGLQRHTPTDKEPAQEYKDMVRDAVFANAGACTTEGITLRL